MPGHDEPKGVIIGGGCGEVPPPLGAHTPVVERIEGGQRAGRRDGIHGQRQPLLKGRDGGRMTAHQGRQGVALARQNGGQPLGTIVGVEGLAQFLLIEVMRRPGQRRFELALQGEFLLRQVLGFGSQLGKAARRLLPAAHLFQRNAQIGGQSGDPHPLFAVVSFAHAALAQQQITGGPLIGPDRLGQHQAIPLVGVWPMAAIGGIGFQHGYRAVRRVGGGHGLPDALRLGRGFDHQLLILPQGDADDRGPGQFLEAIDKGGHLLFQLPTGGANVLSQTSHFAGYHTQLLEEQVV